MKKWKMTVTLLLLALVLPVCGCVAKPNPLPTATVSTTQTVPGKTEPIEAERTLRVQYLPQELENPDDLPVLKWVYLAQSRFGPWGTQTLDEEAIHEANRMLEERGVPFRLQMIVLSMLEPGENVDWFSVPEARELLADADLIHGDMSREQIVTYLSPITEYVTGDSKPSLKNAVPHELSWLRTTVGDQIYGICAQPSSAHSNGWGMDPKIFTEYGFEEADFDKPYWEMDEVFAEIYKKHGNKPFMFRQGDYFKSFSYTDAIPLIYPGSIYNPSACYQTAGLCFVIDHSKENATVINYLEEENVRKECLASVRYWEAGYFSDNPKGDYLLRYGSTEGSAKYTQSWIMIPKTGSSLSSVYPEGIVNGVAAVSQHKLEAVQLLNLVAEDEEFRMQLLFGKENRNYKVENGVFSVIMQDKNTAYGLNLLSPFSFFTGLTAAKDDRVSLNWSFVTRDDGMVIYEGMDKLQSNKKLLNEVEHVFYPIEFDFSGFEKETAAMEEIFEKNFMNSKNSMTEESYDRMLQEIKDAGGDRIRAELQRQLDQWLADNPDWQPIGG